MDIISRALKKESIPPRKIPLTRNPSIIMIIRRSYCSRKITRLPNTVFLTKEITPSKATAARITDEPRMSEKYGRARREEKKANSGARKVIAVKKNIPMPTATAVTEKIALRAARHTPISTPKIGWSAGSVPV